MARTKQATSRTRNEISNAWNKEHLKAYTVKFNLDTQRDVIEHLETKSNKTAYIADLIRKDLIAEGKTPYVKLTVQELAKQMGDSDKVVLLFSDGSKLITDKARVINDNRVVNCYERKELIDHIEWIIEVRYS